MTELQQTQLVALGSVCEVLESQGIDYWLFGGWAVDFHAGAVTRAHDDLDLAVWAGDHERIARLLALEGWMHAPEEGEDGYTGYERAGVRLELAFLDRDEHGRPTRRSRTDAAHGPRGRSAKTSRSSGVFVHA